MNCPHCNVTLIMAERCGVEIDYCPKCRGIWLDKGELDKILERSIQQGFHQQANANNKFVGNHGSDTHTDHQDNYHHHKKHHQNKSWLKDIFDF